MRFLLLPICLVFACLAAGAYGVVHNQISYTVSPDYFHAFKFEQFTIDGPLQNRLGASVVGWDASWWMGLVIGLPIYLIGLFVRDSRLFLRQFIFAALAVIAVTFLTGIVGLAYSFATISESNLPTWMDGWRVNDPVSFARAGTMHNFSDLGGLLGLLVGSGIVVTAAIRSGKRRTDPNPVTAHVAK